MTTETPNAPAPGETTERILAALRRSAERARRTAGQTGTRLVYVEDGELVAERVPREPDLGDPSVT